MLLFKISYICRILTDSYDHVWILSYVIHGGPDILIQSSILCHNSSMTLSNWLFYNIYLSMVMGDISLMHMSPMAMYLDGYVTKGLFPEIVYYTASSRIYIRYYI
jgi:hypothetical protein